VYANHIRKKIEIDPAHPALLLTNPGVGYQLVAE
jgi:DNA-binding response OmpR family regulator